MSAGLDRASSPVVDAAPPEREQRDDVGGHVAGDVGPDRADGQQPAAAGRSPEGAVDDPHPQRRAAVGRDASRAVGWAATTGWTTIRSSPSATPRHHVRRVRRTRAASLRQFVPSVASVPAPAARPEVGDDVGAAEGVDRLLRVADQDQRPVPVEGAGRGSPTAPGRCPGTRRPAPPRSGRGPARGVRTRSAGRPGRRAGGPAGRRSRCSRRGRLRRSTSSRDGLRRAGGAASACGAVRGRGGLEHGLPVGRPPRAATLGERSATSNGGGAAVRPGVARAGRGRRPPRRRRRPGSSANVTSRSHVGGDAEAGEHLVAEAVGRGDGRRVEVGDRARPAGRGVRRPRRRSPVREVPRRPRRSESARPAAGPPAPQLVRDETLTDPLAQLDGRGPAEGHQHAARRPARRPRRRSGRPAPRWCSVLPVPALASSTVVPVGQVARRGRRRRAVTRGRHPCSLGASSGSQTRRASWPNQVHSSSRPARARPGRRAGRRGSTSPHTCGARCRRSRRSRDRRR